MPGKKTQKQAVAERTEALLAEKRHRRQAKPVEAKDPAAAKPPKERRVRVHADMVTVALKGEYADRMRKLAEGAQLSLGKLLRDMLLVYQERMEGGYQPGASLQSLQENRTEGRASAE